MPVNEGTVPVYRLSVIQSGTEELSVAWTRMAGEEDAVWESTTTSTGEFLRRELGSYLGLDTGSWQLAIAHTGSSFFPSHCPMSTYPGVSQG